MLAIRNDHPHKRLPKYLLNLHETAPTLVRNSEVGNLASEAVKNVLIDEARTTGTDTSGLLCDITGDIVGFACLKLGDERHCFLCRFR